MDAGGGHQRERTQRVAVAHGEVGRDPAAERGSDEIDLAQAEFLDELEIEVGEIADVVEPLRRIGASEAGMLRYDHVEALRQCLEERQPHAGAACAVEEQERCTPAAAQHVDLAPGNRFPGLCCITHRTGSSFLSAPCTRLDAKDTVCRGGYVLAGSLEVVKARVPPGPHTSPNGGRLAEVPKMPHCAARDRSDTGRMFCVLVNL